MIETLLGNDLVVNEDSCNLGCTYCLTGQSTLKQAHLGQPIFAPPTRDRYAPDSALGRRLDVIDARVTQTFQVPLLKVTGGEIFLVDGIVDFLAAQARRHTVVMVQTNGLLVRPEHLAAFAEWGNVVIQLSLDSHLPAGNSYRCPTEALHRKTLDQAELILDSGVPVEVYAVLNDRSIADVVPFAAWLAGRTRPPIFFPFPVRGPDSERFAVRPDQHGEIDSLIERYDELAAAMPPRAYLHRLRRFYAEGGRTFRCHLPRLVVSTFSDGMVTPCPNIWFSDMGNVLDDEYPSVLADVGATGLYAALLAPKPRLAACKGCFTPWDTLSMYFDDEITLDELCAAPTYAPAEIRQLLAAAKAAFAG